METHAAHTAGPTPEQRALTARLASLCRERPAAFARLISDADAQIAQGRDRWEVISEALDQVTPVQ